MTTANSVVKMASIPSVEGQRMAWFTQCQAALLVLDGLRKECSRNKGKRIVDAVISSLMNIVVRQPTYFDHQIFVIRAAHLYVGSGSNNRLGLLFDTHVKRNNRDDRNKAIDAFTDTFEAALKPENIGKRMKLKKVILDVREAYKRAWEPYDRYVDGWNRSIGERRSLLSDDHWNLIFDYAITEDYTKFFDVRLIGNDELIFRGMRINETNTLICDSLDQVYHPPSLLARIQGIYYSHYLYLLERYARTEKKFSVNLLHGQYTQDNERGTNRKTETEFFPGFIETFRWILFSQPRYSDADLRALADNTVWPPKLSQRRLTINNAGEHLSLNILFPDEDKMYLCSGVKCLSDSALLSFG